MVTRIKLIKKKDISKDNLSLIEIRKNIAKPKKFKSDVIFKIFLASITSSIFIIIGLMLYYLINSSWLSLSTYGINFLYGTEWNPTPADPNQPPIFGALPPLLGTLVTSGIALLISVPISIGIALTLSEFVSKRFNYWISFFVELLAAVPSVVYGLWGIFILIPFLNSTVYPFLQNTFGFLPFFQGINHGYNILTGSIILSIMITPTIAAISRDSYSSVPESQREAIIALGATKWECSSLVRKNGRSGVIGAIILGLGRAVGETMAITMVIGNSFNLFTSLFNPGYTLASLIANEFTEASSPAVYLSAIIEIGLVLFLLAFIINIVARLLIRYNQRKYKNIGGGF